MGRKGVKKERGNFGSQLPTLVKLLLRSIGLGNSYLPTCISESELSRGPCRIPSFPLGNTTFPTSMERYFLYTGKLVSEPNGTQQNSSYVPELKVLLLGYYYCLDNGRN